MTEMNVMREGRRNMVSEVRRFCKSYREYAITAKNFRLKRKPLEFLQSYWEWRKRQTDRHHRIVPRKDFAHPDDPRPIICPRCRGTGRIVSNKVIFHRDPQGRNVCPRCFGSGNY